jgi:hypothetical protein
MGSRTAKSDYTVILPYLVDLVLLEKAKLINHYSCLGE